MNLLSNGIFAMKERGGVLSVRLRKRDIDSASAGPDPELRPGPYLELSVGDTGRGMSPDVIARMFDHFFTTKEPGEGAGIGMAVVRRIVTNLAGGISVASEPGRGTTVTVFLPRAAGPETNAPGGGGPLPGEGQPA
jgi:signal transduction histidine kinase